MSSTGRLLTNRRGDFGLYIRNRGTAVKEHTFEETYVYVRFGEWSLLACYISPNISRGFRGEDSEGMELVRARGEHMVILVDLNE